MRRSHRDSKQGLAEDRRRLIHRYMGDAGGPPPDTQPAEELTEHPLPDPVELAQIVPLEQMETPAPLPTPAAAPPGAVRLEDEPRDQAEPPVQESVASAPDSVAEEAPAEAKLRLPPAPHGPLAPERTLRILEEVARLSEQLERLGDEAGRRRSRLARTLPPTASSK